MYIHTCTAVSREDVHERRVREMVDWDSVGDSGHIQLIWLEVM
jgi:hypothetical protein